MAYVYDTEGCVLYGRESPWMKECMDRGMNYVVRAGAASGGYVGCESHP